MGLRRRAPAVVSATAAGLAMTAVVTVAAPGLAVPTGAPGGADTTQAADPPGPRLELGAVSPAAPKPTSRLTVRGTLVNPGPDPVRDAEVSLRVSTAPVGNRGDLAAVATGATARTTRVVPGATAAVSGQVLPDKPGEWQLSVPLKSLKLPGNGVYVLEVVATGRTGDAPAELAKLTTFLPYLPAKGQYSPTKVTWLWPLAATPARDAHGAFLDGGPTVELENALANGGRLAELATAPGRTPVTWFVDPELLESANALGKRHEEQDGTTTDTEDADAAAAAWLAGLRTRLAEIPVAALPYADPDVVALTRHGDRTSIGRAVTLAKSVTAAQLGRESDTAVAWPPDGLADLDTLAALRRAGAKTVVLSSAGVVPTAARTYTPTGRARVDVGDGALEVLVADQGLTDSLGGDLAAPGAAALAGQRFLADTALITLERPNAARTVLVAPPRRWNPPAGWSAGLLGAAGSSPWLRTVALSTLSKTRVPAEYAGAAVTYPQAAVQAELSEAQVKRMSGGAKSAADVVRLLARPGRIGGIDGAYNGALLSSMSSAWRTSRTQGREYALEVADSIGDDTGRVRVIGRNLVTLSSSRGTIPLTVSNQLGDAIRVRPVLRPRVGSRLNVATTELLTVGAGRKKTIRVDAEAAANGITQVEVVLLDASGRPFGEPTQLRVNVTSFGRVGLIVLVAAGSVLFGAAIVRNVNRFRRRTA